MRAIRVGNHSGGHVVHPLADDDWTLCGRQPNVLKGGDRLELESLGDEACAICEELRKRPTKSKVAPAFYFGGPSLGTMRTTGPLYHGTKPRQGRKL
jgi:hypothetical protein